MAPLLTLVTATPLARLLGLAGVTYVDTWPKALAVGLSAMFAITASAHLIQPRRNGLIAIVPPWVPAPSLMVSITGGLEVAGALGLLVPAAWFPGLRGVAAIGLAALMVAMFPANVHAAGERRHPHAPHTPLLPRIGMQTLFVLAAVTVAVSGS